jgi:hypothetical protein
MRKRRYELGEHYTFPKPGIRALCSPTLISPEGYRQWRVRMSFTGGVPFARIPRVGIYLFVGNAVDKEGKKKGCYVFIVKGR